MMGNQNKKRRTIRQRNHKNYLRNTKDIWETHLFNQNEKKKLSNLEVVIPSLN
jgi:hypothetical protein